MLRWTLWGLVAIGAAVLVVALVGWLLPTGHQASRSVVVRATRHEVFALITDVASAPTWRSDVSRVDRVEGAGVGMSFREVGRNGTIAYRVEAFEPDRRFVTRIADPSLPFGGTWTFDLEEVSGGTRVTITEDGQVFNPIFRFMSRFVFSPTATIEHYQTALNRKLTR